MKKRNDTSQGEQSEPQTPRNTGVASQVLSISSGSQENQRTPPRGQRASA
jgi:hypothetical protein